MTTAPASPSSSTLGSKQPLAKPVRRAAVVTHGKVDTIGPSLSRLMGVARDAGVELLFPTEEVAKHGLGGFAGDLARADLAIVLGGDGTMLRALQRFLGTGIAAIGVNFGRVGFLASIAQDRLDEDLPGVFAGRYRIVELPTLDVKLDGGRHAAVNDVVAASSVVGRMVELSWTVGGEDLGRQACDGIICATPQGSTAYNLSNGGPVLVWGIDAAAVTFIAPHSLHARSLVVPRGLEVVVTNETRDVSATVLYDGQPLGEIPPSGSATVGLGEASSLLATLPEVTFFRRYRQVFAS
jgi:NAD+ kinase